MPPRQEWSEKGLSEWLNEDNGKMLRPPSSYHGATITVVSESLEVYRQRRIAQPISIEGEKEASELLHTMPHTLVSEVSGGTPCINTFR